MAFSNTHMVSRWRAAAALLLLTALAASVPASAVEAASFQQVRWQPEQIVNGSVCLFTVDMKGAPDKLTARWMGRDVVFAASPSGTWYALAGVDVKVMPGRYELALEATLPNGTVVRQVRPVMVAAARYKTSKLKVPQKYVTPDPETMKRIEEESKVKAAAFDHVIPKPVWAGNFVAPISTTVSEDFGVSRTFNGKLASIHRGLDYHAPMGTPVRASNDGEVVLARGLFYEGNCVIIDHGLGFMTLYMHLSQLEVKEGDKVTKGQELGLSGDTGRATGPHLHLAVRWNGSYLDPAKLLALTLPAKP